MKEWILYYVKKNKINVPNRLVDQLIEEYGDNTKNVINEIDWKSGYYRNDIGWKHLT